MTYTKGANLANNSFIEEIFLKKQNKTLSSILSSMFLCIFSYSNHINNNLTYKVPKEKEKEKSETIMSQIGNRLTFGSL